MGGHVDVFSKEENDSEESDTVTIDEIDGQSDSATEESSNISNNAEDDRSDDSGEELAAFDAQFAQALGTHPIEASGARSTPSEDEDMDDEQMEKLDEQLELMFRERKKATNLKNEQKDAKETLIQFKCKVLELLQIFVRNEHTKAVSLKIIMPILRLIRVTKSPVVSRRAYSIIHQASQRCKGDGIAKISDSESTFNLLGCIHEESGRGGSNIHDRACSQASLQVVRILKAHHRENLRRVVAVYAKTQERFLLDSSFKVKPLMFTDWLNWCANATG